MEKSFQYRVPKARKTRLEQAEARTEQAETRTEQAKSRTESAETRAELAETRTEEAKTRTEHAETRAEKAETALERVVEEAADPRPQIRASAAETGSPPSSADSLALELLTSRQREILRLLASGRNTKQIADELELSPKTIEYHRIKLMNSLKTHDLTGLVRFALRVGLVPANG
jgi:DNA-binding CsgD family transcriptional regulator